MAATNFPEFNAAVTELTTKVSTLLTDVGQMQSIANVQVAVDKAAEASASATAAATSETNAKGAEAAAATSKAAAETSASDASTSATTASTKAGEASTSATNAAASASAASTSATKASNWAEAAENTAVETGKYSAKHHALKAAASATSASGSASTATTKAGEASTSATNASASATDAANSATTATTKAGEASTSATNAAASASTATAKADEASASATTAGVKSTDSANSATASANSATKASNWAEAAEDIAVEVGQYSAKHHALKAAASAGTASSSQSAAAASADTASAKASEAATSATNAANSASTATTKASEAATSATNASAANTAAQTAKTDAQAARDEAVAAAASLTGTLSELGSVDLSSGAYPAVPSSAGFWKVTVGGTVGGIDYGVGDTLVYSKNLGQFYKIDNTESVSSVNGKTGVVTLSAADVGALPTAGTAAAATKLATARTIGGVSFDGTANINLPGVNAAGTQSTTGNAATATKLATARTVTVAGAAEGSAVFDGSGDVTIATTTPKLYGFTADITPTFRADVFGGQDYKVKVLRTNAAGFANFPQYAPCLGWSTADTHAFFSPSYNTPKVVVGAGSGAGIAWSKELAFTDSSITGNAATATKLATARTINGVAFDGSANITVADSTKLPLTGGAMTGSISFSNASTGGWARGVEGRIQSSGALAAMVGVLGSGDSLSTAFLGVGASPWQSGNGVRVTASGLTVEGATSFTGVISGNGSGLTSLSAANLTGVVPDANLSGSYTGVSITGNAATATKLATARTLSLTGDATGSASFDGSANASIAVTVANDSHTHDTRYLATLPERYLTVSAAGWVTIAQVPAQGGRAYGEFLVYDTDSGKHNLVKLVASHAYGQSVVACIGGNRYGTRSIAHVRVLYNTADRTYGGAKLQVYVENPPIALRVRPIAINQVAGWSGWSDMTPVVESPAGWAEDPSTRFDDITSTDSSFTGALAGKVGTKIAVSDTTKRSAGMYGIYDSTKTGHVWSMGVAYAIPDDGSTFGTLYGMAYKHTNNTTGGTMAGGHQIVFCSNGTAGAAVGLAGGIWTSGNVTAYSDIRVKTNIEVIPDALAKVLSLRGVTYERTDRDGERQTGLIAQEVQKVLPEAVSGDDMLSVAYGNLVGLLVEAIKELKAEVDELRRAG